MEQSATNLSTLVSKYLKANRRIEETTAKMTERVFDYMVNAIGDIAVSDFTIREAELFQASLVDKGLRRISVNSYTKTASPVFTWAITNGYVEVNPFAKLKKFKVARKKVRIFTPFELERILKCCPDDIWRARILLGLTSMRKGEVLNLTVDDVDFGNSIIYVQPKDETAYTWRWQPKDCQQRVLPLMAGLGDLLLKLYQELPSGQPYLLLKPQRYSYLLRNRDRLNDRIRKCPDNNFNRTFKSICQRAFVNGCFHMLRKTSLTELTSGLRLQEVQELAGHSSIETTRSYLASRPDVLTRAGDILSRGVAQFG